MADEKKADTVEKKDASPADAKTVKEPVAPSNVKKALDDEQGREKHSKREKLLFTKKRVEQQLSKLGDVEEEPDVELDEEDESRPVTLGDLRRMERERAQQTAVQMADTITDADEKALVKKYLQNRIIPSGNPAEDFALARSMVNAVKNGQVVEEITRQRSTASTRSSAGGAPAKQDDTTNFEATAEELALARMAKAKDPKAWILNARKKVEAADANK
jgi:hypothetical protein